MLWAVMPDEHRRSEYPHLNFFKEKVIMTIKTLFDKIFGTEPKFMVRANDPITSIEAAEQIDSTKLESMVYEVIAKHPNGCTSDEVMAHFPNHGVQSITPRFAPLLRKGLVEDTGEKRKGKSGKSQRVLRVIK